MNRSKLLRFTALFFVFMILFTLLSRTADQAAIAVVSVKKPENMVISHRVTATGKIVQNQELAVTTQADQRVTSIAVSEGQRVEKGDLLFEIDMDLLEEKVLYQRQEMQKQELTVGDAKSQKSVSEQQKANEQAQAAESYSLSTKRAGVQLSRAKEELQRAKQELSEFRKNSRNSQPAETGVEEALERDREEKSADYIQAEQELVTLRWQIENDVNNALRKAENGAALTPNEVTHRQAAEESDEILGEVMPLSDGEGANSYSGVPDGAESGGNDQNSPAEAAGEDMILNIEEVPGSPDTADSGQSSGGPAGDAADFVQSSDVLVWEGTDSVGPAGDAADSGQSSGVSDLVDPGLGNSGTSDQSTSIPGQNSSGADGTISEPGSNGTVTQAELDQIERSVRESYSQELKAAQEKVETARAEKEAAEKALLEYQQERLAADSSQNAQTEQQLLDNVRTARNNYEDAAITANEAAVTGGRAVAAAGIPNAANSADEMYQISYDQMELQLKKLEALKADRGKIFAPASGLVTKINITIGEKTTDTTAILMADLSKGYRFSAEITKEQEKYIGTGDLVTITGSNKKELEGQPVESVAVDEENPEIYHVTIQVPDDAFDIGMTVSMEFLKKSRTYTTCVPLSALHLDDKNQTYVLVPEEYDSVMGTEIKARKVSVTVQEKNESYAALAEGIVTGQDQVIVSSDKAVDEGSRVRISD